MPVLPSLREKLEAFGVTRLIARVCVLALVFVLWIQVTSAQSDEAKMFYNRGIDFSEAGKPTDAIAYYKKAIAIYPGYDKAYYNMGVAFEDLGRLPDASISYRKAISLRKSNWAAWDNLAGVLYKQGDLRAAIDTAQQALSLGPPLEDRRKFESGIRQVQLELARKGNRAAR